MVRDKASMSSSHGTPKPTSNIKKRLHQFRLFSLRLLLLLVFCLSLFVSVFPAGRTFARTTLLLPALLTASETQPLTTTGDPVVHSQMTISSRSGPVYLDIYAPASPTPLITGVRGAVLIIPGVGDNRTVPQLINLSRSLAHTGIVVMNMVTPTLMRYDLTEHDTDAVVQAYQTLARISGVQPGHIGMIAFSAGVPLVCFAAADPRIHNQVAFLTLFGGYFNTTSVLRAFGRRAITVDGHKEAWQPQIVPLQLLANIMADTMPLTEGTLLKSAFIPDWQPLTDQQQAQLSPVGAAAYHLLEGDQPERVEANIATLSPAIHRLFDTLSPSRVIGNIAAPIYLLHDRNDNSVPFIESRNFAAALTRLHRPHDYAEFGIFHHVQVRSDLDINQLMGDGLPLFRLLYETLNASA